MQGYGPHTGDAPFSRMVWYFSRAKCLNTNISAVKLPVFLQVVMSAPFITPVIEQLGLCASLFILRVSSWNTETNFFSAHRGLFQMLFYSLDKGQTVPSMPEVLCLMYHLSKTHFERVQP